MNQKLWKSKRERRCKAITNTLKKIWGNYDNLHIRGYRDFSDPSSLLHLKPEEFYIYSFLNLSEKRNGSITTSLNTIEKLSPISFSKNVGYNREKIKEILIKLITRKILYLDNINPKNEVENLKPGDFFSLEIDDSYIDENSRVRGYQQVPAFAFLESKSIYDLYIYFTVSKWQQKKGFVCSYKRWGDILSVSERTAIRQINNSLENKAIFVKVSKHNSKNKQSVNTYSITSFSKKSSSPRKEVSKGKGNNNDSPF